MENTAYLGKVSFTKNINIFQKKSYFVKLSVVGETFILRAAKQKWGAL